jgi:uncharacterized membrane-anchored protein YhcB (DUF1043 family)
VEGDEGMVSWHTELIALVSLVVGSVLTMFGQAFADRRTRSREREARREDFLIQNFDTQREALLKVQELVNEIAKILSSENRRKLDDGYYEFFESKPTRRISSDTVGLFTGLQEMQELVDGHEGPWSEEEKEQLEHEIMRLTKDARSRVQRIKVEMQAISDHALSESRQEFLANFVALIQNLTLNMYRTGSEAVVSAVNEYLNTAVAYTGRLVISDIEKYRGREFQARKRLHETIGRELKRGPLNELSN